MINPHTKFWCGGKKEGPERPRNRESRKKRLFVGLSGPIYWELLKGAEGARGVVFVL